jgi:hypothetical protein
MVQTSYNRLRRMVDRVRTRWGLEQRHLAARGSVGPELPVRTLPVSALAVHLALPYWRLGHEPLQLTPREVMNDSARYVEQYRLIGQADLT